MGTLDDWWAELLRREEERLRKAGWEQDAEAARQHGGDWWKRNGKVLRREDVLAEVDGRPRPQGGRRPRGRR